MAAASDSSIIPRDSGVAVNPWAAFSKYGLPGLVIAVLFYFMYEDRSTSRDVISQNTKIQVEIVGAVREMKDALKENSEEIRKLREERRSRR